ncbi:MAG: ion transporter, partial [bacterium]
MREAWNWLDFLVVIAGVIELGTDSSGEASSVRVLRVLRV